MVVYKELSQLNGQKMKVSKQELLGKADFHFGIGPCGRVVKRADFTIPHHSIISQLCLVHVRALHWACETSQALLADVPVFLAHLSRRLTR